MIFFFQLTLQNTASPVQYTYILMFCFFPDGISKASRPPNRVSENIASIWGIRIKLNMLV